MDNNNDDTMGFIVGSLKELIKRLCLRFDWQYNTFKSVRTYLQHCQALTTTLQPNKRPQNFSPHGQKLHNFFQRPH